MTDPPNLQTLLNPRSIAVIGATRKKGFRRFDLDCHGIANIISRRSELAEELGPYFNQIDINPIVFFDGHRIALDTQLTLAK